MEFALNGLLSRPEALGIRRLSCDVFVEPEHDPACALRGVELLSQFASQYKHGLLMFDYEGSGREKIEPANTLQARLNDELHKTGWENRAEVIVLVPELERWVWSDSPHVADIAGWNPSSPTLYEWLYSEGWVFDVMKKPVRPKEAFDAVLKEARTPRSASLFKQLAQKVSFQRCVDPSFKRLLEVLHNWYFNKE